MGLERSPGNQHCTQEKKNHAPSLQPSTQLFPTVRHNVCVPQQGHLDRLSNLFPRQPHLILPAPLHNGRVEGSYTRTANEQWQSRLRTGLHTAADLAPRVSADAILARRRPRCCGGRRKHILGHIRTSGTRKYQGRQEGVTKGISSLPLLSRSGRGGLGLTTLCLLCISERV